MNCRKIEPVRKFFQLAAIAAMIVSMGCSSATPPTDSGPVNLVKTHPSEHDEKAHGHEHHRDKMMVAHAAKYHVYLTAHLSSKDGNELDVFVEGEEGSPSTEKGAHETPNPAAIPVEKFIAKAKRDGEDKEYELTFEPAPANERPDNEALGMCSHFVAKAGWMKPDDVLTITGEIDLDGRIRKPKWKEFVPRKYAHHID